MGCFVILIDFLVKAGISAFVVSLGAPVWVGVLLFIAFYIL